MSDATWAIATLKSPTIRSKYPQGLFNAKFEIRLSRVEQAGQHRASGIVLHQGHYDKDSRAFNARKKLVSKLD
jgi:hypothetical protein